MSYVIGAIVGILFGSAVGYLKNLFIWKKFAEEKYSEETAQTGLTKIYAKAFISYTVNIVTLVGVFFLRNILPFDGVSCLIGTAIALAVMNRISAMRQKVTEQ